MVDFRYIKENIDDFQNNNVRVSAASEYGVAVEVFIPKPIDLLDFIEEIGIYFYRIDDPKFGQKFINENTKLFIYDWLTQMLNTGNYDEYDEGVCASLELFMNFDELNTFKYALRKYKLKYEYDKKNNFDTSRLFAEGTAINILELIERVRTTKVEQNI